MKCPRCQHENPPGSNFCLGCGARLGATCGACGNDVPAGSRFCNKCGAPVSGESAGPARFASAELYTPKHLAEKILTSKSALEGERKQVTVLFADLKGSMELLADRDPEEARKILDPVLERMMEAVHRYEGTVNQVMGDGIMALFGAPLAHEDHAVRACYAALRMQEAVKRYSDGVRRTEGISIRIRVGLNSGEVVVRAIGSDLHMDYTAVGQTTHLAARMEQLADPGTVLLTPAALALAEDFIQVRSLGPTPVKGVSEPVDVYELVGATAVRSRFQAHAARGLTKFVGRSSEMAQLAEALDLARGHRGQIVAVVGEPGVGKSRLFWEFAHSHRAEGCVVLQGASVSYGKATTYFPVIELLKGYFRVEDRDDGRTVREKVTGKVVALERALEPALPALLALLDVPVEDEQWTRLDPPQRRRQTLDAVKRLLLRESQVQPLIVMFEDLHWIDGETQAVLDGLVESLPTTRALLLVNYRPEYQHAWGSKTYYRQVRVDALPAASAEELLHELVGSDSGLAPLKRLLIERTEGNPFFLEESVRTLVETKVLAGESGAYRLTRAPGSIQIPATAQAILAARIDRLSLENKQLLQAASVIGKDVPFPLLQAISDEPEEGLRQGLMRLQAAEFLYETRLFPDLEYSFRHALTHEVAYKGVLQDRRSALHARIVEAIEALYPDRLAEHVERLAHHALSGTVWNKAALYLAQAGARAAAHSAYREAVAWFDQALVALEHLPENRGRTEQSFDLRFDRLQALIPLGKHGEVRDDLRNAETVAKALGDQRRLALVYACMTQDSWLGADPDGAIASGQRALAIAGPLENFPLQIMASSFLGMAYRARGDYRRAIELLGRNVASLHGDLVRERFGLPLFPSVLCRAFLVRSRAELGEFAGGIDDGEEAIRIAETADHPFSLIVASFGLGGLFLVKGDLQKAIAVLERGRVLCETADIPTLFPEIASSLGLAYALSGRIAEALPLLEQGVERATSVRTMFDHSLWVGWLSEAYLLAGRIDDAIPIARRAFELSRDRKERGHEAWALRLLGEIHAHGDLPDAETAEERQRQALALATDLGMRPLVAHCHLGLGHLDRGTSKRQEVQEHLGTAITMYREMDMRFWLEKAEAEMRELA